MEYKKKGLVYGAILTIFVVAMMVSSATMVPMLNISDDSKIEANSEDDSIEADDEPGFETNTELEDEEPAGMFFGTIIVQTYCIVTGRFLLSRGAKVYCKGPNGDVTYATSHGFLSLAFFIGLNLGSTYKIYSKYTSSSKTEVKVSAFPQFVQVRVG